MTPRNFTPSGRAHTILARLAQSPCKAGYLFRALGYPVRMPPYQRRKFWRLVDVLKADSLVDQDEDAVLAILPAGRAELARLDALAQAVVVGAPTVRIFTRQSEGARA